MRKNNYLVTLRLRTVYQLLQTLAPHGNVDEIEISTIISAYNDIVATLDAEAKYTKYYVTSVTLANTVAQLANSMPSKIAPDCTR